MTTQFKELVKQAKGEDRLLTLSNILSVFRLLLVPFLVYHLVSSRPADRYVALGLMVLAFLTDIFDGYYARWKHEETKLGKILDPLIDKIVVNSIVISLVVSRDFPVWFAGFLVFRDLTVIIFSYTLFRGRDLVLRSNLWGKVTAFSLGALLFLYVGLPPELWKHQYLDISLGICLTLILGSGLNYLNRFIGEIKNPNGH